MTHLVNLITPKNGIVLDPFAGSHSTGKAVAWLNKSKNKNLTYIGIELQEEFKSIGEARIKWVLENDGFMENEIKTKEYVKEMLDD